jgi:hypothetical protein
MANVIEFAVIDDDRQITVVPLIDGASLIALVAKVELHFGHGQSDPRGEYQGHVLDDLARARATYAAPRTTVLLCADCNDPACWSLQTVIDRDGTVVRWSQFTNPLHPDWDYTALGPFEFDREQYEAAIADIRLPTTMGA